MKKLYPGDLIIVNDDTWLYGGETFMELRIITAIKKGTIGMVINIQSKEKYNDDLDSSQLARVSFPDWIGWTHVEFLEKINQ